MIETFCLVNKEEKIYHYIFRIHNRQASLIQLFFTDTISVRWVEQLMLVYLEGPPLKSLLCEMGGATDAGLPRGTIPEVFTL